jgi:5-methylcytosine-specific restriction endonuclease McrA
MAAVPAFESEVGPEAGLLDAVRTETRLAAEAEVRRLRLVIEYCAAHEVAETDSATHREFGRDTGLALAGLGAPFVSEFAIIELAAALGMTTDAGRRYAGRVLEVHHRLPDLWAEVVAGRVPWWRAARVADHTISLPAEGARFVDAHVARFAGKVTFGQVERLVEEALVLFDPEAAEQKRIEAADGRRFDTHLGEPGHTGTGEVTGTLDLADLLDLETAISQGAAELKALGCEESLDVRRSMAAGLLARRQIQLDLNGDDPAPSSGVVKPRQTVIHIHLSDAAIGRCQTTRSPISVAQVQQWCTNPDTQVIIKPILDLNEHLHTDRYEIPDRLAQQVAERDLTCVFPKCTRPAAGCDDDHCIPHDQGGQTASDNIAAVCRTHHRAKTYAGWTYRFLRPGAYLWTSPSGLWFYRDGTGTTDLGRLTPD